MISLTSYLTLKQSTTCYGCRACEQICPKKVITMTPDDEGFLYPVMDEAKCIKCGLCKTVCPYDNQKVESEPVKVYAAQNKNTQDLLKGSSGSIFSVFAKEMLSRDGFVSGCVFNKEKRAVHIVSSSEEDVERMHGSKYVQSDVNSVFSQIKDLLDGGKPVLFTGTPCQVDGLKRFLKKPYENLLTIDLICHGVPSPALLDEYINCVESEKGKISGLQFRNKARNGWRSEGTISFEKGKVKSFSPYRDSYYNLYYMRNCVSRLSCYECKYASASRVGDITIGDFWNASDFLDEKAYKGGMSAVLVNTKIGEDAFNKIKNQLNIYETDLKTAQRGNPRLVGGHPIPENRKDFYKKVKEKGYKKATQEECKFSYLVPFIKKHLPKGLKKLMKRFLG